MASRIDVINMALANLGRDTVQSLAENGKDVNLLRIHYQAALEDCLRMHPWGFATRRAKLARIDREETEWGYIAYDYPADAVMIQRVMTESGIPLEFKIERTADSSRKAIYAKAIPPLTVWFTTKNLVEDEFAPPFTVALSWRLAAAVAQGVLNDASASQNAMSIYSAELRAAMAADAVEGRSCRMPDGDFLQSRRW